MNAISQPPTQTWITGCAALLACLIPSHLAYSISPSSTFLNQATAVIGWGVFLSVVLQGLHRSTQQPVERARGEWALYGALTLLALSVVGATLFRGLPMSMALSSTLMLIAALVVATIAGLVARTDQCDSVFRALSWGAVLAGLVGVWVGFVQVFAPNWTDGQWLATSALPGRATGNIRQPNHLGTFLLWALVAVVVLLDWSSAHRQSTSLASENPPPPHPAQPAHYAMAWCAGLLLVLGIVLSASRTAALGLVILAAWGCLDSKLSARSRFLLLATPVLYAVLWFGLTRWADATGHAFGGTARFTVQGDVSSSRFGIWSNTLSLITQQPWWGVGWGNFNFSWSLTPFPDRPVAFFDHSHNLVLQLLVELGIPLAILVTALLGWAFVSAMWAAWRSAPGTSSLVRRSSAMMLLLIALHSQLEYPLWYAYFLLPTAFLWGLCFGGVRRENAKDSAQSSAQASINMALPQIRNRWTLRAAALVMVIGGALAIWDYWRVAVIFAPPPGAAPLADRIAAGQRSWLFAHLAHYAAATTTEDPQDAMASFAVTTHQLLDTRLMIAWAKALNAQGDVERAQHVAARLREFRNSKADAFFSPCKETPPPVPLPFQCTAPEKSMDWRAFR